MHLGDFTSGKRKIGVVGLGYVGLPLLACFSRYFKMVGFDISTQRIQELQAGKDSTGELSDAEMQSFKAEFTSSAAALKNCDCIIVAVPTPVDPFKVPDLSPVTGATKIVAENLKPGAVIVYESTVYPGVTEEVCKPLLESFGLKHKKDFHLGYSPERINPGDQKHRFESILKIVSGDDEPILELLADIYGTVVHAGIHKAQSIKVAEAAKVIENTQRDVNIALMNELAMLFHRMNIDTRAVLEAAGTKWNFIRMQPGLVGGHCIGVDPYYLTHKAESLGMHPHLISGGRRINDSMARYVAQTTIKKMIAAGIHVGHSRVLVAGLTFKENVPDTRNSRSEDVISELKDFGVEVKAIDPHVHTQQILDFGATPHEAGNSYDAIVLCVNHDAFGKLSDFVEPLAKPDSTVVITDVKAGIEMHELPERFHHWRL